MTDNRIAELTAYYGQLGLAFTSDRQKWRQDGTDWTDGPYRGVLLHAAGERDRDGSEITGQNVNNTTTYRPTYRNYLRVSIETGPPVATPVCVIPRADYALLDKKGHPVVNGQRIWDSGKYAVGADLMHSRHLALNRMLDGGVPEFDAAFGVLCDDEAYARTLLRPEVIRWIAGDRRSYGARLLLKDDRVSVFWRSKAEAAPPELFAPEWIFPAADYLIDLVNQCPQLSAQPAAR